MKTKTIEVSEYVYERLDGLSLAHELSIAAVIDIGLDYLETKYKWPNNRWEDFLDQTYPLLQFCLNNATAIFRGGHLTIYVTHSFAYDQVTQNWSKLKESLNNFYKKDFNVTLALEHND